MTTTKKTAAKSKSAKKKKEPFSLERIAKTRTDFALMIETACRDFEALDRILSKQTKIVSSVNKHDYQAEAAIRMALAKSFLFFSVRAYRICEHGGAYLTLDRKLRKDFLKIVGAIVPVRDVNEHGFDVKASGRGKSSPPTMHHHHEDEAILDENSLTITGGKILMGPLDLREVYVPVAAAKEAAGFIALSNNTIERNEK